MCMYLPRLATEYSRSALPNSAMREVPKGVQVAVDGSRLCRFTVVVDDKDLLLIADEVAGALRVEDGNDELMIGR